MSRTYETGRFTDANGIKWITVSPDFKIEEAVRGMRLCLANADELDATKYPFQHTDWCNFAREWQSIAISWASR